MEKYTANYCYTNHNFVIQNVATEKAESTYTPIICIIKNMLQRGCPTVMSKFLQSKLGSLHLDSEFKKRIVLIDKKQPNWINTIRGDDENNYYPAKDFFEQAIPEFFQDYKVIQQLILPEAYIKDITGEENEEFFDQRVDFFLPQAKLVIEIDGQQHKTWVSKISDTERDFYLQKFGVCVVRIDTHDFKNKTEAFYKKIVAIRSRLNEFEKIIGYYMKEYYAPLEELLANEVRVKKLLATATIRFQITLLSLLEKTIIKFDDKDWNFYVLAREVDGFAELAIEDLFLWAEHLCKLNKVPFQRPSYNIYYCKDSNEFSYVPGNVNIDFSLFKRWTDENELFNKVIFVRTDYFDFAKADFVNKKFISKNYFKVSTCDPVQYDIIYDGENNDIDSLRFILSNVFGHEDFREGQLPIIINSLRGNDTVGILPTGSGKSICYQMVALLQPCISFVVCPIKSLMYDQKENLDNRQLINNTNYITSDQSGVEKQRIAKKFSEGKYLIIWISPERFQTKEFRSYMEELNIKQTIALAVIDEVHCLSEWGHDFRTSYLNLIKTIRYYAPSVRLLGLTATASVNVLRNIMIDFEIGLENVKTMLSFSRKELAFKIIKNQGQDRWSRHRVLTEILNSMKNKDNIFEIDNENTKSGIIFTIFKNGISGCFKLANRLKTELNIEAKWYSGEVPEESINENGSKVKSEPVMDTKEFNDYKIKVQKEFKNNEFPLLIATKAFGMGVDKPNIRYTIHFGVPGSLEALYQEAGRAGRDGKQAECYVIFSPEDVELEQLEKIFDLKTPIEDIIKLKEENGFGTGDIFNNLFLWVGNNKGANSESEIAVEIFKKYAKPQQTSLIYCKKAKISSEELEKAIYKLSLIGIVKDWTIEDWQRGIIEVSFTDFNEQSVVECLRDYIKNYDKDFELDSADSKYQVISEIHFNDGMDVYEKAIRILISWYYDNIAYTRRQSIKTVSDICNNFKDSEEFKRVIEQFFNFNETVFILDHIAQEPNDYNKWFDVFYKDEKNEQGTMVRRFLEPLEIESLKNSISRFLESYRYNTGLNFISGFARLLLDDYLNVDGKQRLESAFNQIINFELHERNRILMQTIELGNRLDSQNREFLSELLCQYYSDKLLFVYNNLNDYTSLGMILEQAKTKLVTIGERLI